MNFGDLIPSLLEINLSLVQMVIFYKNEFIDGTLRIFSAKERKLLKVIRTNTNENGEII
jgi:hypothetical protein